MTDFSVACADPYAAFGLEDNGTAECFCLPDSLAVGCTNRSPQAIECDDLGRCYERLLTQSFRPSTQQFWTTGYCQVCFENCPEDNPLVNYYCVVAIFDESNFASSCGVGHYESPTRLVNCLDCSICSSSDRIVDVQYTCPPYSTAENQCDRLVTPIFGTSVTSTNIPTAGPTLQPMTHRPTPSPTLQSTTHPPTTLPTHAPTMAYDYVTTMPASPVMSRQPTVNFLDAASGAQGGMTPYSVGFSSFSTFKAACLVLWIICFM